MPLSCQTGCSRVLDTVGSVGFVASHDEAVLGPFDEGRGSFYGLEAGLALLSLALERVEDLSTWSIERVLGVI